MTVTETNFCNIMVRDINEAIKHYGRLDDSTLRAYINNLFRLEEVENKPYYNNINEMQNYIFNEVRLKENV